MTRRFDPAPVANALRVAAAQDAIRLSHVAQDVRLVC
jgi:hypothetical protein